MAFVRRKGNAYYLVHNVRQRGKIKQLHLARLGDRPRITDEIVRQVIRHRFLDPEASAEVITQKLEQTRHALSIRSVQRVIADYGLQKKTLRP